MREMLETLKATRLRFSAMAEDYRRETQGIRTLLVVDTCDLFTYMHTNEDRGLRLPERAVKRLFEDETYDRVLLPPHAYEVLSYVQQVLSSVKRFSTGEESLRDYMAHAPHASAFMRAFENKSWSEANALWNTGVWADLVRMARDQGRGSIARMNKPLGILSQLMDNGVVKPVDQIGLSRVLLQDVCADEDVVRRALHEFGCIAGRSQKHMNNMIDAQALGILVELNERCRDLGCFFTMTTLSSMSLAAYSRTCPDERANICRNTFVSAYKRNLREVPEAHRDPLAYMLRGITLLEHVIVGYPLFKAAAGELKQDVTLGDVDAAIGTLRFMADYTEYYNRYFQKLIEPVAAVPALPEETDELGEAYEILVDEAKFVTAMKEAHATIMHEARELTNKVRPFVVGEDGVLGRGVRIGGQSIADMFESVVSTMARERRS